jgi:hypothetical protein
MGRRLDGGARVLQALRAEEAAAAAMIMGRGKRAAAPKTLQSPPLVQGVRRTPARERSRRWADLMDE